MARVSGVVVMSVVIHEVYCGQDYYPGIEVVTLESAQYIAKPSACEDDKEHGELSIAKDKNHRLDSNKKNVSKGNRSTVGFCSVGWSVDFSVPLEGAAGRQAVRKRVGDGGCSSRRGVKACQSGYAVRGSMTNLMISLLMLFVRIKRGGSDFSCGRDRAFFPQLPLHHSRIANPASRRDAGRENDSLVEKAAQVRRTPGKADCSTERARDEWFLQHNEGRDKEHRESGFGYWVFTGSQASTYDVLVS
ncbi:hypothetical protein MLD38_018097 [Melastoma candidum]|uniref:Uncharacterized protein n=1 Tax=Melastoma candidum TaxID=119954 RepID=A0ACB9QVW6_9MYRT|nr:hypothetical protein MLD38_018097 [Melastoma candidum]